MTKQFSKKLVICALITIFAFSLIGCGSSASDPVIGKWKGTAIVGDSGTTPIPSEDFITLEFTTSGKYTLTAQGSPSSGKWEKTELKNSSYDNVYLLDGAAYAFLDGDELFFMLDDIMLVLKK